MTATYHDIDALLRDVSPDLLKIEKLRQNRAALYRRRMRVAIPATLTLITLIITMMVMKIPTIVIGGFMSVSSYLLLDLFQWANEPKHDYIKRYKFRILPLIANTIGKFKYHHNRTLPISEMERSGLIPRHHIYQAEDFFEGRYKGVDLCFWEARMLEDISLDGSRKNYMPVFTGLIVYIHIPRYKFSGHTVILKDRLGDRRKLNRYLRKMKRAHMVDPEFEKLFTVFTTDQVEGRYLVNPLVIESIKAIHKKFSSTNLSASFYEDQMVLMIPSALNHFEPGSIDMRSQNMAVITEIRGQIKKIVSIIDELNLSQPHTT